MPEISVIVPVYKAEQYLDRCVRSILEQTYRDIELILVDDGSPDNSPKLCDVWKEKDHRVRVLHKANGGASSARNAGLGVAKGNWIAFVDSDDWLDQAALRLLYDLAIKYDVPMSIGGFRVVHDCKNIKPMVIKQEQILHRSDLLNRFFRLNGEPDVHSVCGMIVRRDVLADYRFIEGRMNEDVEACYYLARMCEVAVYTSTPVYYYFKNNDGVTNSVFTAKKLDLLYIWDCVRDQVAEYTPDYNEACAMNCKRARFTLLTQMNLNGYDHHDTELRKIKKKLRKEVQQNFWNLLAWKMPVSRKIILVLDCIIP